MRMALLPLVGLLFPTAQATAGGPDPQEVQATLNKAFTFLRSRQNADGSFAPQLAGPGITALATAAMIRGGVSPDDPTVAKSLAYLEKKVQKDGGVYEKRLANYTTSVALVAFREANQNGRYDTVIKNAAEFLKKLQFVDSQTAGQDPRQGGVGYDGRDRPDLSNTGYFVEALLQAGVPKDDPAVQRALVFVSRCQNLAGEHNDQPFAKKASADDKGGFTYNPIANDRNPNKTPEGGLRSAGAMTYTGLMAFLHAQVAKDDPRVQAALDWIARHYTLDESPGQGQSGLYYYYHTFAKAMAARGEDTFTDAAGTRHDWRAELFQALKKRQRPDGSWSNTDRGYFENNPELATSFAVLALSYCRK